MARGRVRMAAAALAVVVGAGGLGLLPATPAQAAGVTTHGWMALAAIGEVDDANLRALLTANEEQVRAGGHFPDTGYVPGNQYGEEAHWQRFADAYVQQIRSRDDCGNLAAPNGPCAPMIAHLMGTIGHGMGDEVFDWLFEPYAPDLDEYYLPDDFGSFASPGGQELQMDLVAIEDHHRSTDELPVVPSMADLLAAFDRAGFDDVDADAIGRGAGGIRVAQLGEAFWAPRHIDALHDAQPWMSRNLVTAPGGVAFAAEAIAGYMENTWGQLLGDQPPTEVSITYPADGQRRIPATGWNRTVIPGSNPGTGGARVRITGALTYALPYVDPDTNETVSEQLPAGSMQLVERDTEAVVPLRAGTPRSVPYGPSAGHHLVTLQPSVDLQPCTWYRVDITADLLDENGAPVTPHSWEFRTGLDAVGNRCADDPFTADEKFAQKVTSDVLDRTLTEDEVRAIAYDLERRLTRRGYAADVLRSEELRGALVTEAFQRFLGRAPDPSGLAYWRAKLATIGLTDLHVRLAASDEVFRKAGGTNAAFVAALYPMVFGRAADPSGQAYWTGRLDRGASRAFVARALLTSREISRRAVIAAYEDLLGRAPDPGGLTYWTNVLQRGTDVRRLWESIINGAEYDRRAQDA